eukprot:SAG31_NODE_34186_length_335_cov_1.309322_1_plen_30_part_01
MSGGGGGGGRTPTILQAGGNVAVKLASSPF